MAETEHLRTQMNAEELSDADLQRIARKHAMVNGHCHWCRSYVCEFASMATELIESRARLALAAPLVAAVARYRVATDSRTLAGEQWHQRDAYFAALDEQRAAHDALLAAALTFQPAESEASRG